MSPRLAWRNCSRLLVFSSTLLLAVGSAPSRLPAAEALREFSEKEVAGGSKDFMVVRHLRLVGSNRAIGAKLADIAHSRHGVEPDADSIGKMKKRWHFFKSNYPSHFARAAGAADFFGAPVDGPADTLSLWYNMDLAPGCSVVYYPPEYTASGHATLSRNYDFLTGTFPELMGRPSPEGLRPMTADPYVIEVYPDEGYPSLYICAYDLLGACIDGVNSQGLTVAILANNDPWETTPPVPSRGARTGLNELELGRFLLDRCATVDEARDLLSHVPVYYSLISSHYIIGDRSGRSLVFEYSNDLEDRFFTPGDGRPQVITNHPVHLYEAPGRKKPSAGAGESFGRCRRLEQEIEKSPRGRSVDEIKRTNACVKARSSSTPRNPVLPPRVNRTLWHAVYDCTDASMEVDFYLGESSATLETERRSGYIQFKLDPSKLSESAKRPR